MPPVKCVPIDVAKFTGTVYEYADTKECFDDFSVVFALLCIVLLVIRYTKLPVHNRQNLLNLG